MLKNMKIGKKIVVTIIFIEIMFCFAGVIGIFVTDDINSKYSYTLTNYGFSENDIGLFSTEFNHSCTAVRNIILETDAQKMQADSDEIDNSVAKANTYFANMKNTMVSSSETNYYNEIKDNMAKYKTACDQVIELAKQSKKSDAYTLLTEQAEPISNKIIASTQALIGEKSTAGHQLVADLSAQGESSNNLLIAVFLFVIILSLVIAIRISRGISKPVKEMADAAQKMAKGDLSVQIRVNSKDEIGQLGIAFAKTVATMKTYITDLSGNLYKMAQGDLNISHSVEYEGDFIELDTSMKAIVNSLNDILAQINQASELVSSGSSQVSDGAQGLAQGAAEQASSIEELSASIEEMSSIIKNNAEHAVHASEIVNHVSSEIEVSNHHMDEMIAAMSHINDSSKEIAKIIKTIEDIAFQTNILSLNAAVEAARAGEAGKGFAVVADEVRNLASKSAEAAKSTTSLIENSIRQVESGTKIADETAKSLLKVVESAKVVSDTVETISQASVQQSESISQVTLGVEQISNVVQTNSATAEESAAASEELSGQAETLKDLVGKFRLRDQPNEHLDVESQPQSEDSKILSQVY